MPRPPDRPLWGSGARATDPGAAEVRNALAIVRWETTWQEAAIRLAEAELAKDAGDLPKVDLSKKAEGV